jgi:hypothetical protein
MPLLKGISPFRVFGIAIPLCLPNSSYAGDFDNDLSLFERLQSIIIKVFKDIKPYLRIGDGANTVRHVFCQSCFGQNVVTMQLFDITK